MVAYFLGSIPTGIWMGRLRGIEIREKGSGNVGATNVARVVGKVPGFLVLIIDAAKGWFPTAILFQTIPSNGWRNTDGK